MSDTVELVLLGIQIILWLFILGLGVYCGKKFDPHLLDAESHRISLMSELRELRNVGCDIADGLEAVSSQPTSSGATLDGSLPIPAQLASLFLNRMLNQDSHAEELEGPIYEAQTEQSED